MNHTKECQAHKWNIRWVVDEIFETHAEIHCMDIRCGVPRTVSVSVGRAIRELTYGKSVGTERHALVKLAEDADK